MTGMTKQQPTPLLDMTQSRDGLLACPLRNALFSLRDSQGVPTDDGRVEVSFEHLCAVLTGGHDILDAVRATSDARWDALKAEGCVSTDGSWLQCGKDQFDAALTPEQLSLHAFGCGQTNYGCDRLHDAVKLAEERKKGNRNGK